MPLRTAGHARRFGGCERYGRGISRTAGASGRSSRIAEIARIEGETDALHRVEISAVNICDILACPRRRRVRR